MADGLKISVQFRYFLVVLFSVGKFHEECLIVAIMLSLCFFVFSGGAELLFNKVKEHDIVLPKDKHSCD